MNWYHYLCRCSCMKHRKCITVGNLTFYLKLTITHICAFSSFSDIESNAGNQRIQIEDYDPSVQSWNISDYCNPSTAPVIEEHHVIVAEGDLKI